MTFREVEEALKSGKELSDLFEFTGGQDCMIYKADQFVDGDEVIYISDLGLVVGDGPDSMMDAVWTGLDFLDAAGGNRELAEKIFCLVDWQSPYTEADQLEREEFEYAF